MKGLISSEVTIQEQAVWPNEEFRSRIRTRTVVLRVLLGDSEGRLLCEAVFEPASHQPPPRSVAKRKRKVWRKKSPGVWGTYGTWARGYFMDDHKQIPMKNIPIICSETHTDTAVAVQHTQRGTCSLSMGECSSRRIPECTSAPAVWDKVYCQAPLGIL